EIPVVAAFPPASLWLETQGGVLSYATTILPLTNDRLTRNPVPESEIHGVRQSHDHPRASADETRGQKERRLRAVGLSDRAHRRARGRGFRRHRRQRRRESARP